MKVKTDRCHPIYTYPEDFDIFRAPNHWANGESLKNIILPYVQRIRRELSSPDQYGLVIFDVVHGHLVPVVQINQKFG